ncbi:LppU/SCO3897 family protein [Paractinoplanes toevensis]|nr:hypothetical protein [Actinoplanes toevensis]
MTSEGQYAGTQPAEATSGGPTADGFPPDADGRRIAGRASAPPPTDGFPSSYAPPPPATPNGGSPFVVPAVRTFGSGSEAAAASPARPTGTSYGSARVPQPEEESPRPASPYGSVSPGAAASYGSATPQAASSPFAPPPPVDNGSGSGAASPFGSADASPRGASEASPFGAPATGAGTSPFGAPATDAGTSPFGAPAAAAGASSSGSGASGAPASDAAGPPQSSAPSSGPAFVPASGNAPEPPRSAWAPQQAPAPVTSGDNPFPLPQRKPATVDPGTIGEFDGFAAGTPGRGSLPDLPSTDDVDPATGRPPGVSVFGAQRVRVPGATLAELPDAPSSVRAGRSGDSGGFPTARPGDDGGFPPARPDDAAARATDSSGFPLRSGNASFPTRRGGDSGGFPLRGAATPASAETPSESAPITDLPIRSQQAPFGPPTTAGPDQAAGSFSAFGDPSVEEAPHPYGRSADSQPNPYGRPAEAQPDAGQSDPFGRPAAASSDPYGRSAGSSADPFGRPSAEAQSDPFGRPSANGKDGAYGRSSTDDQGDSFGRPSTDGKDGTYGRPSADDQGDPFGRPSGDGQVGPFGRRPAAEPSATADSARNGLPDPFGRTTPGDSATFGSAPETAGSPFGSARSEGSPGSARPDSLASSFKPRGAASPHGDSKPAAFGSMPSDASAFGGEKPFGSGDESSLGAARPGTQYGSAQPASPAADQATPFGSAQPSSPAAPFAGDRPGSSAPFGSDRPGSSTPFAGDQPAPFGSGQPSSSFGSARPGSPDESDDEQAPFKPASPAAPFGSSDVAPFRSAAGGPAEDARPLYGSARPAAPDGDSGDASDQHAIYRRPDAPDAEPNAYPQRVPGASFGLAGSPVVAENRSVPAPRDPSDQSAPAVGSARPVTASASVPSTSRSAPVDPAELPPPPAASQARVYGRPAAAEPEDDEPADEPGFPAPVELPFDAGRPASGTYGAPAAAPAGFEPPASFGSPAGTPSEFGAPGGFGSPAYPQRGGDHNAPGGEPGVAGVAPLSPARATARASASARVAPPAPGSPAAPPAQPGPEQPRNPLAEFTSPAPASGGGYPPFPPPNGNGPYAVNGTAPGADQYSELTTDISGRGNEAYAPTGFPMPVSPETSGAASRATVTPPSPDDTTSWPGPGGAAPAKPETPHVRMLPILVSVVVGAVLLLGVVFGIVYLVAGGDNETLTVNTGECVKQDGSEAVKVDCSDATSFQVVSIVDDQSKCPDPQQPHVLNPTSDGKNQVLCLKPQG